VKKIVEFITLSEIGGAQIVLQKIIENLKSNYKFYLITSGEDFLVDFFKDIPEVEVIVLKNLQRKISIKKDFLCFIELYKILRDIKPDIVHAHSSKAGFLIRLFKFMNFDFEVFFTVHGFISSTYSSKTAILLMDFIEKITSSLVDHFIFVSENDSMVALDKGWKIKDYKVIYNGIEEVRQENNRVLSKLVEENNNKMIFGTVARLSKQKNPLKLLNLINNNPEEFNDKFFIWIGSGNLEDECREFVEENNLERNINFTGKIMDANKYVKYFDVFYLLSSWECLPISIIEALQQGLPILATDVGGVSEMVTELNGILLTKNYNEKEFLESINALSYETINNMSNNSVRIYKENFTLKKMIQKYNNIFR